MNHRSLSGLLPVALVAVATAQVPEAPELRVTELGDQVLLESDGSVTVRELADVVARLDESLAVAHLERDVDALRLPVPRATILRRAELTCWLQWVCMPGYLAVIQQRGVLRLIYVGKGGRSVDTDDLAFLDESVVDDEECMESPNASRALLLEVGCADVSPALMQLALWPWYRSDSMWLEPHGGMLRFSCLREVARPMVEACRAIRTQVAPSDAFVVIRASETESIEQASIPWMRAMSHGAHGAERCPRIVPIEGAHALLLVGSPSAVATVLAWREPDQAAAPAPRAGDSQSTRDGSADAEVLAPERLEVGH